jgi:ribosome-associated protein
VKDDLEIRRGLVIPASELNWRFDTSGGPGGQHANRAATRVELWFDLGSSPSVPEGLKASMLESLGHRAGRGIVTVSADDSRSQWRNRSIARKRMIGLLREASRSRPVRRPSRPSRAARRRRLEEKRRRGEVKRLRRPPEPE